MSTIQHSQSRVVTWNCILCNSKCIAYEKDFPSGDFNIIYVCHCSRRYTVIFGKLITVKEETSPDTWFTVTRELSSIEARLAWDREKGCVVSLGPDYSISEAIDVAIGRCWRLYGEEIIAHIQQDTTLHASNEPER